MAMKIKHNNKLLLLTRDAHIEGTYENEYYTAHATDSDMNEYEVRWEIVNTESDDGSDACDWDKYTVRAL